MTAEEFRESLRKEIQLLKEYLEICIQLLSQGMDRWDLPRYEYYKQTRGTPYCMQQMTHRETLGFNPRGEVGVCRGDQEYINTWGLAQRRCAYWKGKKYFAYGNTNGRFEAIPTGVSNFAAMKNEFDFKQI